MAKITGRYSEERNENLKNFFNKLGLSEDVQQKCMGFPFTVEILDEGDHVTINMSTGLTYSVMFKEDYDVALFPGVKISSERTNKGFKITKIFPSGAGTSYAEYEFTDHGYTTVLTFDDVIAKRYFKRVD